MRQPGKSINFQGQKLKSPPYSLGNKAAWNIKYFPGSETKFPSVHFETKIRLERGEAWKINHSMGSTPKSPLYSLGNGAAWKIDYFPGPETKIPAVQFRK